MGLRRGGVGVSFRGSFSGTDSQDHATPLPLKAMFVVVMVLGTESVCYQFLFPFVPFMVRSFGVAEEDVGFSSGWIASAFMIGQLFSSIFWGWASDRIGIRPVIMFGLAATVVCTISFGCSQSLAWAVGSRLVCGLLNGNIGVCKTFIYFNTDETNEAKAFGLMSMCWGAGGVLGPSLGGLLSMPATKYPSVFAEDSLFGIYPFLLPCLAAAVIPFTGFVSGIWFIEEPVRKRTKKTKHVQLEEEVEEGNAPGVEEAPENHSRNGTILNGSNSSKLGHNSTITKEEEIVEVNASEVGNGLIHEKVTTSAKSVRELIFTFKVALTIMVYANLRLTAVGNDDATPLFMSTPKLDGGMEFTTQQIGFALLGQGFIIVLHVAFIFPWLKAKYGALELFKMSQYFVPLAVIFIPFLSQIQRSVDEVTLWIILELYFVYKVMAYATAFTAVTILVNNCAHPKVLGTINGISQTAAAFTSAVAPAMAGIIFSWSLSNGYGFPFDWHFAFFVLGILAVLNLVASWFLDPSVNSRTVDDED